MTKQQRLLAFLALATLCALPVDATAGGFGLFKRCHKKKATCCPPPAYQACTPSFSEIVITSSCDPCETKAKEPLQTCWGATGSGVDQNYNPVSGSVPCKYTSSYQAIYALYAHFSSKNWLLFTFQVSPCVCIRASDASEPEVPSKIPGPWNAILVVKDPENPVLRASGDDIQAVMKKFETLNADKHPPVQFWFMLAK